MESYYQKATARVKAGDYEGALTDFISGLEEGDDKCAFGILRTVTQYGSYTITEDEAVLIFQSSYPRIKKMAQDGDAGAMVIVAEGIRNDFVCDDDEPYLFWLTRAAGLGDATAMEIIEELDQSDDPWALPGATSVVPVEARECMDSTDIILLDDGVGLDVEEFYGEIAVIPEERVLIDEPDRVLYDELGISSYIDDESMFYEVFKSSENYDYE